MKDGNHKDPNPKRKKKVCAAEGREKESTPVDQWKEQDAGGERTNPEGGDCTLPGNFWVVRDQEGKKSQRDPD